MIVLLYQRYELGDGGAGKSTSEDLKVNGRR